MTPPRTPHEEGDPLEATTPTAESAGPTSPASAPPSTQSPFAPPSTWMPPASQPPAEQTQFPTLPKTFESPFAPPVSPGPAQPTSAPPSSAQPTPAQPTSAPPTSAPPMETANAAPAMAPPPQQAPPQPALPQQAPPPWMAEEQPTTAMYWPPVPAVPVSPPPQSPPAWQQQPPWAPRSADPYALDEPEPTGRRTPRFVTGLVIGLVVAVLAATGAFFIGNATAGKPAAKPSAAPSPTLPGYEANEKTLNEAKFSGDLAALAQPWLPYLGFCLNNSDPGGPTLLQDENKHVFCRYGSVFVHFAQYKSQAAMNIERDYRKQLNQLDASLAPGQEAPAQKKGGVSHAQGDYVEYALKSSDGRPLCGIWWSLNDASSAVFMEALCHEALGDQWAPLRDLWQRYS